MKSKVNVHFNQIAKDYDYYKIKNNFYYINLKRLLKKLVLIDKQLLEFGCGTGDLISYLNPKSGVGYDPSVEMIKIAKTKHKKIKFYSELPKSKFDYVFMSDVIEHLEFPEKEFKRIKMILNVNGKLLITMANPIWEPVLMLAEKFKLKMPEGPHKRIVFKDIENLTNKIGMKVTRHDYKLLVPVKLKYITTFFNKYLEKYLKRFCFIEYIEITKL